jgi:hypothetical protein
VYVLTVISARWALIKQVSLASPKLFSFFVNELSVMMNNDDKIKGIQIIPNEISIWLSMFADDVTTVRD